MSDVIDPILPAHNNLFVQEAAFLRALRSNQPSTILSFLDEKFVFIGILGQVLGFKEFVTSYMSTAEFRSVEAKTLSIIEERDFCIVVSEVDSDVTLQGTTIRGLIRVTRTWVRRDDAWKILSTNLADCRIGQSWQKTLRSRENP